MKLTEKKLQETLDKIAKILEKRPEVLAAYLYGSYAKGYARDGSDLDIAIMTQRLREGDKYNYQFDLEAELYKVNKLIDIQVVLLDNMNYPLRYNASVGGQLFYSRDDRGRISEEFKIQDIREDLDDFFEIRLKYNIEGAKEYLNARSGSY